MKNHTRNWKKRKEKRRRMEMAKKGLAVPFLAQRPLKPMPPLVRTSERTETIHRPDGTIVTARCQLWHNEIYGVAVYEERHGITQITIQREDCNPARDWRHLQQIKNEVIGEEREAVEIYPAESRKVDLTNTTHLWVMPVGEMVPFGMVPPSQGVTIEWGYEPIKEVDEVRSPQLAAGAPQPENETVSAPTLCELTLPLIRSIPRDDGSK